MEQFNLATKRLLVGIISLVCLALSALVWIFGADPQSNPVLGSLTRIGIVLGTLWFALPREGENVAWSKALVPIVGLVVVIAMMRRASWWLLPAAVVIGIAIVIIRPKKKR
ncbi:MAG: hypothetical protein NT069_09945 [Planctomycetota bacterium]|nr:hypothetical protein [Planctomycetota bacterium]